MSLPDRKKTKKSFYVVMLLISQSKLGGGGHHDRQRCGFSGKTGAEKLSNELSRL